MANKEVIFKNCGLFTNYISRINNTQVVDAHGINVIISMYNSIEYSDSYSKTSEILWKYFRDKLALNDEGQNFWFYWNLCYFWFIYS